MDTLTHFFVPYAAFTWARRPQRERLAAAVGGASPDLDALWAWLSHVHEYAYPLVHRGFSHTLLGAPLLATVLWFLLSRPGLARRWTRFAAFAWTPDVIGPLWIGAFTHLLLDGVTITGIPLLWPLDDGRYTTDWFFFGVPYLLPISLVAIIQIWRRKATDLSLKRWSLVLLVVLALAGTVRAAAYPHLQPVGADVTPAPSEWQWYVSVPYTQCADTCEDGILAYATTFGDDIQYGLFQPHHNQTEAADALRACEQRPGYTPWKWYLWGLPVINATRTPEGGWRIQYSDSDIELAEEHPGFTFLRSPARSESDPNRGATCLVAADGTAHFERDRGWIGS